MKRNFFKTIIITMLACFIFTGFLLAVPAELKVNGKNLQTVSGSCIMRLVGVNTDGMEWAPVGYGPTAGWGGDMTQSVTAAVNTWKANCIRVPISQDFWFGYGNTHGTPSSAAAYRTLVDNVVATASNLNCYVEIDLHWSGTGSYGTSDVQQDMPDDNSIALWTDVATHYKNNPGVIFNIYNEPKNVSWSIWKNGGTTTTIDTSTTFHTPGFQALVKTIRDTGAKNIISIGGLGWAWDLTQVSANSITDTNTAGTLSGNGIMYEAHIYDNKGGTTQADKIALWNSNVSVAVNAGYCVMIGEFGPSNAGTGNTQDDSGCTPFESDLIAWINGTNTASYAYNAMAWDFNTTAPPCVLADWSFNPTTCHGTQVKNWLAAVTPAACAANSPTNTPVQTETFTPSFTMTATPANTATASPTFTSTVSGTNVFANGADVGWLSQMEASGNKFYNNSGTQQDCLQILKDLCVNSIRLRVWVNPSNGYCGKTDVVAMAVRAHNMGFRIMIDFHYSDSWADPGQQNKPAAWTGYTFPQLVQAVYDHTYDVLSALDAAGVTPEWVQVGNETNNGMLWDASAAISGRATDSMSNYAQLEAAGYNAVKAINSSIKVIVHISNGYDNTLFRWIFDGLENNGGKWDVIGMSMYPDATNPYTTRDPQCLINMNDMVTRYPGKEIMISEFGYDVTQAQTAHDFAVDLMNNVKSVPNNKGLGVFYWEPECYNGWQGYDKGAFDNTGKPTLAMNAFAENCVGVTATPSNTATVVTATFTETNKFAIPGILPYPNPVYGDYMDLKIKISITQPARDLKLRIYTVSFRCIMEVELGAAAAKEVTAVIPSSKFARLSTGTYYIVVAGMAASGENAISKPQPLIILK